MSQSRPFSAQNADPPRLQGPDENGFTPVPAGGEAAVVAFQAAWLAGRRPNIADFLPRDGACGSDIVTKLAQTDLAHRIEADEAARAEEYLVAWPVLAADRDSALELIEFEYQLRRRREGHLPIDDYCRRFPQFAAQLTARWGGGLAEETHLLRAPSDPIDPGRREPLDNTLPTPAVEAFDSPPVPGRPSTRYCVVRLHAKGGIGEVYVADDGELRREVALKRIQSRFAHDFDCRRRFLLEAEITARLQHPGIVPVYGLVEDADGQPSYAMRFIEGKSFKDAIDEFHRADVALRGDGEHSLALRKLLNRFVEACNAVEYAHSRGVVHRDLKPANIMLGEYGETLVVDWGLAKVMGTQPGPVNREETAARAAASDGESQVPRSGFAAADALGDERTQQGVIVGTPQFMSPEQADGRQDLVGPASDVYSLGATLYSLLAGQPPFANVAFDEMFDRIRYGVFPRPREVRAWVPAALEAVCVKAMSLAPAQRYSSARALADDIEHWLADEPVAAVRDSLAESVARWTRRHRAWTRASIVAGAVVTLVAVVGFVRESNLREAVSDSLRKETAAREAEREAGARADSQRREAQRQARIAVAERLAMQAQMLAEDRPVLSSLLAVEAWMTTAQHGEGPLATAQQVIRRNLTSIGGQPLIGHTGFVTSTAISPDDRWLATGSEDATVRLWDMAAHAPVPSIVLRGHEGGVMTLAFSRNGRWLASGSRDSTVQLWKLTPDGPSTSVLVLRGHQGLVRSV
ncbi:MAG TPA: serine/threonine-protein kinase, partial [Pirellulales bacterium]|nr:serine/threonine-protein kinase [Pirellulales bacterium]